MRVWPKKVLMYAYGFKGCCSPGTSTSDVQQMQQSSLQMPSAAVVQHMVYEEELL